MTFHTINGDRLHVTDTGETGAPMLFIQGLMLASDSWRAQVEQFAPMHRVITFDLRGQGESEKTRDRLGLDDLAGDAAALLGESIRFRLLGVTSSSRSSRYRAKSPCPTSLSFLAQMGCLRKAFSSVFSTAAERFGSVTVSR
jgi:pimeloyl-ACP methyl ester carboxylesterase